MKKQNRAKTLEKINNDKDSVYLLLYFVFVFPGIQMRKKRDIQWHLTLKYPCCGYFSPQPTLIFFILLTLQHFINLTLCVHTHIYIYSLIEGDGIQKIIQNQQRTIE